MIMVQFIDAVRGKNKPIDAYLLLLNGEYDQGDCGLISYDELYDIVNDAEVRAKILTKLKDVHKPENIIHTCFKCMSKPEENWYHNESCQCDCHKGKD
jgi:hypothetical protein